MEAEELIKAGKVSEALAALKKSVAKKPADKKLRVFLYQLFCICGDWERAMTQLNVCADMNAMDMADIQVVAILLQVEKLREKIFSGERTPLIFGEPQEWISKLIQALGYYDSKDYAAADKLRQAAYEAAPTINGNIDNELFDWIADGDSRLGPCIEMIIEGKYYWAPLTSFASINFEPTVELKDLVWTPATFGFTNGGSVCGFIPTRYPQTTADADEALLMSRKTEWLEAGNDAWTGLGQKMFVTDKTDYSLLTTKRIAFDVVVTPESSENNRQV